MLRMDEVRGGNGWGWKGQVEDRMASEGRRLEVKTGGAGKGRVDMSGGGKVLECDGVSGERRGGKVLTVEVRRG